MYNELHINTRNVNKNLIVCDNLIHLSYFCVTIFHIHTDVIIVIIVILVQRINVQLICFAAYVLRRIIVVILVWCY